jgi:alkanesulfonate monooxygenase SsuD/methylene tetrahydromethanopterin reductase-like flavin-dependent oxidoreductase (luciferase family)
VKYWQPAATSGRKRFTASSGVPMRAATPAIAMTSRGTRSRLAARAAEFAQFGLALPSIPERQEALEETIQIIEGLWGAQPFTYKGKHFKVENATIRPSIHQARLPILIAGGGERVTLRQVAQYADMSNFGVITGQTELEDHGRGKYAALRRHCGAVGRPCEANLRSHTRIPLTLAETRAAVESKLDAFLDTVPPPIREAVLRTEIAAMTPREAVAHYREVIAAGAQYCIVSTPDNDFETLRLLAGTVIPELLGT